MVVSNSIFLSIFTGINQSNYLTPNINNVHLQLYINALEVEDDDGKRMNKKDKNEEGSVARDIYLKYLIAGRGQILLPVFLFFMTIALVCGFNFFSKRTFRKIRMNLCVSFAMFWAELINMFPILY